MGRHALLPPSNYISTLLSVDGCIFEQNLSTPLGVANASHDVKITQDMGYSMDKTFAKDEYLFITLTFRVSENFYSEDINFSVNTAECSVARAETYSNEFDTAYGEGAKIRQYARRCKRRRYNQF